MTLCTFFKNFKKYTFKNIVRVFIIKHHLTGTGDKSAKFREKDMYISPVWKIQKMVKNLCLSVKNMRIGCHLQGNLRT